MRQYETPNEARQAFMTALGSMIEECDLIAKGTPGTFGGPQDWWHAMMGLRRYLVALKLQESQDAE